MRVLHLQVNQSLSAVRDSAANLALKVNAAMPLAEAVALGPSLAAPAPGPVIFDSDAPGPPSLDTPAPRQLDSKDVAGLHLLTPRELEVLRLIGEGLRTKEIAFSLGITFKTAVTHRSNIMEKLDIHEGPRLVRFAIRTGVATA